jgi:transcriptional regulator with XRE-family HTH domain
MEFRQRLQQMRTQKGISQKVLSELCGLYSDAVRRYENGAAEPTMHALVELADYFGCSIDYLVGRK